MCAHLSKYITNNMFDWNSVFTIIYDFKRSSYLCLQTACELQPYEFH